MSAELKTQLPRQSIMEVVNSCNINQIATIPEVKDRWVKNYNLTHVGGLGEMAYHKQLIHLNMAIAKSANLQKVDKFSIYAVFITCAVKGWSLDVQDDEVYIIPRDGKACLQIQANARVKRLINTGQIIACEPAQIVFEGDNFKVSKGRVILHERNFQSTKIIAGYVIMKLDSLGTEKHFIYDQFDWESWRIKSPQKNGENWNTNGQPLPGFLKTKIISHACQDRSWSSGDKLVQVETFEGIEVDENDYVIENVDNLNNVQTISKSEQPTISQPIAFEVEKPLVKTVQNIVPEDDAY